MQESSQFADGHGGKNCLGRGRRSRESAPVVMYSLGEGAPKIEKSEDIS